MGEEQEKDDNKKVEQKIQKNSQKFKLPLYFFV